MVKTKENLDDLKALPLIKEWLEDNELNDKQEKTLRRQLQGLKLIFPKIREDLTLWTKFLALDSNKKNQFFECMGRETSPSLFGKES